MHVPFRSTGASLPNVIGGQIDAIVGDASVLAPQIEAGTVNAMAVASSARALALPNVPTMSEAGLPGVISESWFGLVLATGTPAPIVARLHGGARRRAEGSGLSRKPAQAEGERRRAGRRQLRPADPPRRRQMARRHPLCRHYVRLNAAANRHDGKPLASPLPIGERSTRFARRVRGNHPINSMFVPLTPTLSPMGRGSAHEQAASPRHTPSSANTAAASAMAWLPAGAPQ